MNVLFNLLDEFFSRATEEFEFFACFCNKVVEEIIFPLSKGLLQGLLFFTLPIWIVPFSIIKKRREKIK